MINNHDKSANMLITVFTPTYNRGYIIGNLYESLKRQTFKDFEWLIVDDGSTDNTEEVVSGFIKENPPFPIRYIKTENGGKHRAINRAVKLAQGTLFFIVDSDDHLPNDSLEVIQKVEDSIPKAEKKNFAGICGQRFDTIGTAIGKTFKEGYIDTTTLERKKYGIAGDKAEVYYTNTLKKYPFPEIDEEKFCTESIVWDRISKDGFKLRFFNHNIYECDYLDDGLTHQGFALYAKNPRQWGLAIYQDYKFGKTNLYQKSIEIYKYYVSVNDTLTLKEITKYLRINKFMLFGAVILHSALDSLRVVCNRKTIKESFLYCKPD